MTRPHEKQCILEVIHATFYARRNEHSLTISEATALTEIYKTVNTVTHYTLESLRTCIHFYTEGLDVLWSVYDRAKDLYQLRCDCWEKAKGCIND